MSLDLAIQTLDELVHEVDTTIRAEFSEYGDRLDEVIWLLRTTDRTDVHRLVSQMGRMQEIMEMGTKCPCEPERRWHACLGRLSVAVGNAAHRYNTMSIRTFCESMGVSYEGVMDLINMISPDTNNELPELPNDVNIPSDLRDLA